jgi:hypothetical protein
VEARAVRHPDVDDVLEDAVQAAVWRPVGDRRLLGRRQSAGHVDALEAAVLALWAVPQLYDVMDSAW